ncbi:MAG: 4Fe-4S binding protein [Kiritimatiellia bacterium]|jgi:polyferredoxin|nr:4Fe-4S binding protein [Kiritimatiellia bacterium]
MSAAVWVPVVTAAASRFPQPQFDSGHAVPQAVHPPFAALLPAWADVLILAFALAMTVWLVRRVRSRRWLLAFSVVCLVWFGFVRQGCICPVGAVQNVAVAAWSGGGLPWSVAALFALPLLAALLFGRVFCGAVCPLGAIQDLFIITPQRVPRSVDAVLRLVPPAVLAVGLVYAVNGAGYLICRTDPFVGFFRRSAPMPMFLAGMAVLLAGMVVARPYCRYFCPYGVLLEWCSRLAWRPFDITAHDCINCRLCVGTCPVDAIVAPRAAPSDAARRGLFRRFVLMLALAPLVVAGCAAAGWLAGAEAARAHPTVIVAERVTRTPEAEMDLHPEIEAFKRTGRTTEQAAAEAAVTVARFRRGCAWAGAFVGVLMALRLLGMTRLQRRALHAADRERCIACGRCLSACPKNIKGEGKPTRRE